MKTRFYLFIGFMLLIVFSCEKDDFLSDALDDPNSIEAVQAWFEASHSEFLSCKISGDKTPQHLKPNWSQITKASNSEYDVIECHVPSQFEFGYIAKEASKQEENNAQNSASFSKLVISTNKETGDRESFLMTLISSHGKFENLQQNTYLKKEEDFSGFEILSDAKGSFVKARRYLKGESAGAVRLIYDEAKQYKIPDEHADGFLATEIYFWQQETATEALKDGTMQANYSFSLVSASYYYWWWASEHSKPVKDMVHKVGKNVDTAKLQAAYDELREDCFYRVIDDLFREYEIKLNGIAISSNISDPKAAATLTKLGNLLFTNNKEITVYSLQFKT